MTIAGDDLGRAARRLASAAKVVEGARLLWVDDTPDSIVQESRLLEQAGAVITRTLSTDEAVNALNRENFDLVLSDIARGDDDQAGLHFADELVARRNSPPIVFYVGAAKWPPPRHAFGIADRPDELVHLVLDSLARTRS
jgi:CheY-like chemotaxis protein